MCFSRPRQSSSSQAATSGFGQRQGMRVNLPFIGQTMHNAIGEDSDPHSSRTTFGRIAALRSRSSL